MNEIRLLRSKTSLSAQKFGDRYGIPLRTIQNWESGTTEPPRYLVELLKRVVEDDIEKGIE